MQPDLDKPRLLDVIDIPEPCQVPWETMTGDERIRHCGMCKKNVYNISEMSTSEAETFLQENLGSACLGFTRRADGTIVTDTCPKILKPVRNGFRRLKKAVAIVIGAIMSASASFAQGESSSALAKEQCAALAEGRFKVLASEPHPRARFGYVPNIYRLEAAKLPAGYGKQQPVPNPHMFGEPLLSFSELITGDFALKFDSEIYAQDGKWFISEEQGIRNLEKVSAHYGRRVGSCVEGLTPSGAFKRGQEWVGKHDDRIAEYYFKLALKLASRGSESVSEVSTIVRSYADLLKRNKRTKEAQALLNFDFSRKIGASHGAFPKGASALGLDPAVLTARPGMKGSKVLPLKHQFEPVPFLNPFAPIPNSQKDKTENKRSSK
jgi:hypothetical protein